MAELPTGAIPSVKCNILKSFSFCDYLGLACSQAGFFIIFMVEKVCIIDLKRTEYLTNFGKTV
jgi:hypothetical protein